MRIVNKAILYSLYIIVIQSLFFTILFEFTYTETEMFFYTFFPKMTSLNFFLFIDCHHVIPVF